MHGGGESLDDLLSFLQEVTGTAGRFHKRQLQAKPRTTLSRNGRNRQSVQNELVVETPARFC
jgi:hypothetical protein